MIRSKLFWSDPNYFDQVCPTSPPKQGCLQTHWPMDLCSGFYPKYGCCRIICLGRWWQIYIQRKLKLSETCREVANLFALVSDTCTVKFLVQTSKSASTITDNKQKQANGWQQFCTDHCKQHLSQPISP